MPNKATKIVEIVKKELGKDYKILEANSATLTAMMKVKDFEKRFKLAETCLCTIAERVSRGNLLIAMGLLEFAKDSILRRSRDNPMKHIEDILKEQGVEAKEKMYG